MFYVLEVQHFQKKEAGFFYDGDVHMGYMNKVFRTKKAAANYYDLHNTHMRKLNTFDTWKSDWDPVTRYRYVVRDFDTELCLIPSFEERLNRD